MLGFARETKRQPTNKKDTPTIYEVGGDREFWFHRSGGLLLGSVLITLGARSLTVFGFYEISRTPNHWQCALLSVHRGAQVSEHGTHQRVLVKGKSSSTPQSGSMATWTGGQFLLFRAPTPFPQAPGKPLSLFEVREDGVC